MYFAKLQLPCPDPQIVDRGAFSPRLWLVEGKLTDFILFELRN